MKRILLALIMLFPTYAWGGVFNPGSTGSGGGTTIESGTSVPSTCTPGTGPNALFLDTDDEILYVCTATDTFQATTASEADTMQSVFARGKEVTGANSLANAFRVGDGVTPMCLYTDATLGPIITPCTDSNVRTLIPANFTWGWYDREGLADMFIVDPDAATTNAMYRFQSGYRPWKSIWFGALSLTGDGTNCPTDPAAVTINSGPRMYTFICGDNDSSTLYGQIQMPLDYDGGTILFQQHIIQTASNTSALNGDITAQCRSTGETVNNTWGTEVALDVANVIGSNANVLLTSAAHTPDGTCTAEDMLYFRYQVDATGTTTAMATTHILGFRLFYRSNSWSH